MEFDAQFACGMVWAEVDGGLHEAADEAAGVVTATEGFAGKMHEGGFAAVGDELDGVDEVFAAGSPLLDALVGWEVFELDVMGGGFALGFEGVEGGLLLVELGELCALARFVAGYGGGGDVAPVVGTEDGGLVAFFIKAAEFTQPEAVAEVGAALGELACKGEVSRVTRI